jgi:hypothetical protein
MGLHDGTRIGTGGGLFGIGFAVLVALLVYAAQLSRSTPPGSAWDEKWFLASFALALLSGGIGVYFLIAVWVGLPTWLPTWTTAMEREFQPRLVDTSAEGHRLVPPEYIVVKIGTRNAGRGNVDKANVNVLVPDFITYIERCDERGGTDNPRYSGGGTDQTSEALIRYQPDVGSIYWNNTVSFPGRVAWVAYFLLRLPGTRHDFPLRLKITAPELEEESEQDFHIRTSDLTM